MADKAIPVLIPRRRVTEICGLQRSAIYERVAHGTFPKPVTIGSAAVRWVEAEIVDWVQQQIEASRNPSDTRKTKRQRSARARNGGAQ